MCVRSSIVDADFEQHFSHRHELNIEMNENTFSIYILTEIKKKPSQQIKSIAKCGKN